jgi:PAB-dependent poly(A)-specific ribonuclease subunit 2
MSFPQPVTSLSFDPISDTLWAGNTAGVVLAYHGASRMRGVSYYVARGDPIKNIISSESVVHACTSSSVGSWGKGGANKWYHQLSAFRLSSFECLIALCQLYSLFQTGSSCYI